MVVQTNVVTKQTINATTTGNSADISVMPTEIANVIVNLSVLTGGTAPTVTVAIDEKDEYGNYVQIFAFAAISAINTPLRRSIGPGLETNVAVTKTWRLRWTTAGAPTTATLQVTIYGDVTG